MRFSDLPALTDATLAAADIFPLTDASDTNDKKITAANLAKWVIKNTSYQVGDAITTSSYWDGFGFVTNSGTNLVIYLPVYKSLEFVSGLNITAMTIAFRSITGGYFGGNWYNVVTDPECSFTADVSNNVIMIQISKTSGWGATNNTPATGRVRFAGTFS